MVITFCLHLYETCTQKNVFLIWLVNFQNCAAIKKSHYGFKTDPYPNILIPLANWTSVFTSEDPLQPLPDLGPSPHSAVSDITIGYPISLQWCNATRVSPFAFNKSPLSFWLMVLIHYNVIDILIVPLNASTVYHILEMLVVGIVFDRLSLFVSIIGSLFPFC